MTLRTKVGRKGYIILPKAIREAVGIDEGDEVVIEVRDGIVIKPVKKKIDVEAIREKLRAHTEKLKQIKDRKEPKPGELATISLEEEFED
ncbi:MAG: AbrB/MazE/SpoVT family DNA-binding domain-containing protein [Staphylothermus sp.]|nr:AbrB/MazE/SpoVT family DNA-binding domain-containing protein [Staphylothermus sp.]